MPRRRAAREGVCVGRRAGVPSRRAQSHGWDAVPAPGSADTGLPSRFRAKSSAASPLLVPAGRCGTNRCDTVEREASFHHP